MGDTQSSQAISPNNQGIAEHAVLDDKRLPLDSKGEKPPILVGQTSLEWIKVLARDDPGVAFTSLAHRINFHLLKQSFKQVRRSKSCGVDKVTAKEYAKDLDTNLYNLFQRLQRGQYVAQPVKRIWIDKEGGKKRPIGISNIFLHHVLDDWFVKEVQARLSRRSFLVRFADDFIIGCELESDARKVLDLLMERFRSFALNLHPEKTKLLPFGRPSSSVRVDKRNGASTFLDLHFSRGRHGRDIGLSRRRRLVSV